MRLLRQFSLFATALVSALTLVACDGGGTTASLTSIAANTASSSLYVAGPATQVTVTGYYSDGRTSDDRRLRQDGCDGPDHGRADAAAGAPVLGGYVRG